MDLEILTLIYEAAKGTSPVLLQIGYTLNNTCRQGIVVKEAPPAIINRLIEAGYTCDLRPDGLHVYKL